MTRPEVQGSVAALLARARLGRSPTSLRELASRYLVAWVYLTGFAIVDLVYLSLPPPSQAALLNWASTDAFNLRHDPIGCVIGSAFLAPGSLPALLMLIALAMFGANRAIGNWPLVAVCAAGHVIGTLVSEGVEYYRIVHGLLPIADTRILDVGPSYVVVAAAVIAILLGSWPARIAAGLDLLLLILVARIFSGLPELDVAAVGHATAITVAALAATVIAASRRRRRALAADQPDDPAVI